MVRSRRPSAQTIAILLALAEEPTAWWYGYDLCRQLDIKPGSLYPILVRLADRGLLETAWGDRRSTRPTAATPLPADRIRAGVRRGPGEGDAAARTRSPTV